MGCLKLAYYQEPELSVVHSKKELSLKISSKSVRSSYLYLYNGKELQQELGVDWYDYGARFYDPQLGRFTTMDPMAEKFDQQSSYAYALNNPVRYTDYLGLGAEDQVDKDKEKDKKKKEEEDKKKKEEEQKKEAEKKKEQEKKDKEKKENANESEENTETTDAEKEDVDPSGKIMTGTLIACGAMLADDATVVGVVDDPVMVATFVTGSIWAGSVWLHHQFAEHVKGKRNSTKGKHQEGQTRKLRDRGGEKGDIKRDPPRLRPPGWKGPWPPKN